MGRLGNVQALPIASDGTPVRTAAYPRSKRLCSCREQGIYSCNFPRLYSQPDCDSGWDSARECYFNGYHLYMFTAADSFHDLPLYPVERSNKREKIDYMLEAAKHRSAKMWIIRIYEIMMCQHMDAWYEESEIELKSLLISA